VNKVILIGNATADAQLRQATSGKNVCTFRLATNRRVRSASGQESETTQFHQVVCWESLAEIVGKYVTKGKPLYVEGRLEYRAYEEGDGTKHGVAEIIANDVQFLGTKGTGASSEAPEDMGIGNDDVNLDEISF
jgi:single-strand DNA-binding protein